MTLEEQLAHAVAEHLRLQALWRWKTRQPYSGLENITAFPTGDDVIRARHRVLHLKYDIDPSAENLFNLPMIDRSTMRLQGLKGA